MCSRPSSFRVYSVVLALVCLFSMSSCSSSSSPKTDEVSALESDPSSLEPKLDDNSNSNEANSESANDPWLIAIDLVVNKESRSIAVNQMVSREQLNQLEAAGDAAELLLDQGVVDDIGLKVIANHLPNIEHLRIRLSPITNDGAAEIARLTQLRVLNLPQSRIGAAGIMAWSNLPNLEHIRLGGSQLDDAAMEALVQLPNLQSLHLIGPSITVAGLQSLGKAKKLTSLYVDDCELNESAWQQLKTVRPDLHFHLDQNHRDRVKK